MRDVSAIVDYREDEEGLTPLMLASKLNWKDGVFELVRTDASLTAKCNEGLTAIEHAKKAGAKSVIKFYEEYLKEDDDEQEESQASQRKRLDIERTKEKRRKEEEEKEAKNVEAKANKIDGTYDLKAVQTEAAALSKWEAVKDALEQMSAECRIDRTEDGSDKEDIDPALWKCQTLKILRIKMPKTHLTSLPAELGQLANLTELIVSSNSLISLPSEIGLLVNLKALEAEANELESLPDELGKCEHLEVVNVTANKLTSLAPLTPLTNLLSLLASQNAIENLDIELETKERLQVLSVSDNQLVQLPPGVGALKAMKELHASNNLLEDLPTEMGQLSEKKLLTMRLDGNKFKDRKIKSILEKSVKPVKELTNHLSNRGSGGGGGGKGKKKKK